MSVSYKVTALPSLSFYPSSGASISAPCETGISVFISSFTGPTLEFTPCLHDLLHSPFGCTTGRLPLMEKAAGSDEPCHDVLCEHSYDHDLNKTIREQEPKRGEVTPNTFRHQASPLIDVYLI